jgi:hypothetical protein
VFDLAGGEAEAARVSAKALLGLSDEDMQVNNSLANRMIDDLSNKNIEVLDLRSTFSLSRGPWYWDEHHMNLRAHAKIAELLEGRILERMKQPK